jgi:exodeoxyribonuclease V alpha subunit
MNAARQLGLGPDPEGNTLVGVVDRVVYANEDNGFAVLRLAVRGQEPVTVVGTLLGSQPGETLRLEGEWIRDKKFGKQFKAEKSEPVRPQSLKGIERFLGSGLIEGIGETTAKRLVEHFGLETLDVIDRNPERLREVGGIGKVRLGRIAAAWRRQYHLRDLMVFLKGYEVPNGIALKIAKRYGDQALEVLRRSPHQLAREVHGIGFLTADRIARDLGVLPEAFERLAAGLLHVLEQASARGHTYAPLSGLRQEAAELLAIAPALIDPALATMAEQGELVKVGPVEGLFAEPLFQLPWLARAEEGLARRLRLLTAQQALPLELRTEKAIEWFEERENIELAEKQRQALAHALTAKVMVLTGGPGTGKTTLLRGVVEILKRKKLEIQLAAPTGRAAKRLAEATGQEARTIHRLLEWKPDEHRFLRGPDLPLAADLLVVDEASMLDTQLAYQLLAALRDDARLLFVGDVDQLPSVGPGRVLADVIDSGLVEVERLNEIFRQAARSQIVVSAHRVRDGVMPDLGPGEGRGGTRPPPREPGAELDGKDFFFIEREEPDDILATLKMLVVERIPQRFGFSAMEDIQVLTPMRRGLLGAANLNGELQAALNPDGQGMVGGGHLLRVGDRVMQRRNNYDLGVFNGDVGRVLGFDLQEQRVSIDYDGRTVLYPFADLDELSLAYACSIHKSQGSEYPCVVIPLHTQHFRLLQRNLLYTAITRGRKLVVIVGSRRALQTAVRQQGSNRRPTLLVERLRGLVT